MQQRVNSETVPAVHDTQQIVWTKAVKKVVGTRKVV